MSCWRPDGEPYPCAKVTHHNGHRPETMRGAVLSHSSSCAALLVYGFYTSLAGQPLVRDVIPDR